MSTAVAPVELRSTRYDVDGAPLRRVLLTRTAPLSSRSDWDLNKLVEQAGSVVGVGSGRSIRLRQSSQRMRRSIRSSIDVGA